jgi:hypothetical protein
LFVTRRRARLAAVVASVLGALILAGCKASATVAIRVRPDGSGTVAVDVTLDRDATRVLDGGVAKPGLPVIPLDDLHTRGWSTAVRAAPNGGTLVQLRKPFTGGAGLASALAQLDGRDGALRDVSLVRGRSLLRDHDAVSLLADLTHLRAGVSDDAALAARLRSAGINVASLDAGLRARIKGSFDLTVRVELPDGTRTTIRVEPGQQRRLSVSSTLEHTGRRAALIAAAAGALLGLVLLGVSLFRARRARRAPRPGAA